MLIDFSIKDIIDIVLVALMLYYIYRIMRESRSLNIFIGIMIFVLVWLLLSQILDMRLLGGILDKLVSVGVIALIILFQEEIRKFLYSLGSHRRAGKWVRLFARKESNASLAAKKKDLVAIVMACMNMARSKTGALIVIERTAPLDDIIDTGEKIDAKIKTRLIENLFFKNAPLHDGALVIRNRRLAAAGCILPVSHDLDIPKELGLRHRAALGISQDSDALAIICSEETGRISVAIRGELQLRLSAEKLEQVLTENM